MAYAAIQNAINASVVYCSEVTFGTPQAAATASKTIRRVSSSLMPVKDFFQSNEVRPDFQLATARHGMRSAKGAIAGELSTVSWDDFLASLLRGTWAAGASKDQTVFTSVAADSATSKFTVAASTWQAQGFKVGDVIRFTNLSEPLNNAVNYRITSLSTVDCFVTPAPTTMGADLAFTVAVAGNKLAMGTVKSSYSIEVIYNDVDTSIRYDGSRIGGGKFNLQPNGITTASFDVLSRDFTVLDAASSPYFTNITAAGTTDALDGTVGAIRVNGTEQSVITALDFDVNLGLSTGPVIGTNIAPDIFHGRFVVSGNVSAYLVDKTLINVFVNESAVDIVAYQKAPGSAPEDFLCFNMQNVKFGAPSNTLGADGGVIVQFPFTGLLKTGGTGTNYDQTTLSIQRSN